MIDLRSDTVTKPSDGMREAMARAEVGDDVYGEDPTVNLLQERVADLLGKEAALFVPSGVMANQLALKCHTQPGDEVVVESSSHIFLYETGAPAWLSNVQLATVDGADGILSAPDVAKAIRSSAYYLPKTSLVCLENTHNKAGGTIYPLEVIRDIQGVTRPRGVQLHLDGARLWNASVAANVHVREYAQYVDSLSVCFSKGLGAPVGSALVSSRNIIEQARKYRKMLGGGMRQSGILAAGALYALDHNIERLATDHRNAFALAQTMTSIPDWHVKLETVQTNIVIADISATGTSASAIVKKAHEAGVLISDMSETAVRAVTHLDATASDVERAGKILQEIFSRRG
ncbi:MAG: low-specificity L-threonine aldolase [Ignavibacteriales bacterium]|nr:low-specificity L-threonine aldolase [Ignavibacteriales bacterium]